jgi:hypothetical protein
MRLARRLGISGVAPDASAAQGQFFAGIGVEKPMTLAGGWDAHVVLQANFTRSSKVVLLAASPIQVQKPTCRKLVKVVLAPDENR